MSQDDDSGRWRTLGLELIGEARPLPTLGCGALTNSLPPAQAGVRVSTSKPTRVRRSRLNSIPMR